MIGFDRSETILDLYAAKGHPVTREAFPIRCDDQMVCWHLMLAGAGLGFAQALIAKRYPSLERVDLDLAPSMPVWLVLHEDVRANRASAASPTPSRAPSRRSCARGEAGELAP